MRCAGGGVSLLWCRSNIVLGAGETDFVGENGPCDRREVCGVVENAQHRRRSEARTVVFC